MFRALSYQRSCLLLSLSKYVGLCIHLCSHCSPTFLLQHPRAAGEVTNEILLCVLCCWPRRQSPQPDAVFWRELGLAPTGFREPSCTAPMGLSKYLMPPVNELASHSHRSVLRCMNIPYATETALLALPTGLPTGWGVLRVRVCKEITF